jgi:lambda repressor-like predicted transcriptional regulator
MALFFDTAWFDARLAERGLSRRVMAAAAGLNEADLALVFKDQRELSAEEVAVFAELLGVPPAEIALNAGVSTPVPGQAGDPRLAALERRVDALEAEVARLKGR